MFRFLLCILKPKYKHVPISNAVAIPIRGPKGIFLSGFDFSVFNEAGAAAADNLPGFDLRCSSSVLLARLCMASYLAKVIVEVGTCRAVRRVRQTC